MKNNITILCLSNIYSKKICQKFADSLDMFFVDVNDILEYNLVNSDMLQSAGKSYFDKQERKTIMGLSQYENALFRANIELLTKADNIKVFKENSVVLYVKLPVKILEKFELEAETKQVVHPLYAFDEEDKFCKQNCDCVIEITDDDAKNVEIMKGALVKYYADIEKGN